jgi:hypothetical protein
LDAPRPLHAVLRIFLATRIGVLAVGYAALLVFGYANGHAPIQLYDNELMNLPFRYDAGWYFEIASEGYRWNPSDPGQQTIAFFPAYPLAARALMRILSVRFIPAAMLLTLAAGLAAFVYLYRFAREDLSDDQALAAVALLAAYPFSVFYSAPYSEPLFLLSTVGAWFHFRREQYVRSGVWGVIAGLTRANGCLLSVPLAILALQLHRRTVAPSHAFAPSHRRTLARLVAVCMPGVGMLIFSAYIYKLTGNPLQWSVAHEAWGRTYTPVGQMFGQWLQLPAHFRPGAGDVYLVDFVSGIALLAFLALSIPVYRRLGLASAVYIPLTVLPPLLAGGLLSMGRITSVLFPAFVWLGAAIPERHRAAWIVVLAMGQALAASMFFTWRPLF